MNSFRLKTVKLEQGNSLDYDLSISCLGFESRAITTTQNCFDKSKKRIAIGFEKNKVISYLKNLDWYTKHEVDIKHDVSDEAFEITVKSILNEINLLGAEKIRVAVDISCFDRYRLAILSRELIIRLEGQISEIDFYYNIAAYSPPSREYTINAKLEPVHPSFVGSRPDPFAGTTAIIGLGYEKEKALGAAEYLEANEVFVFSPASKIPDYLPSVLKANELLIGQLDQFHSFIYRVEDPADLVSELCSVTKGALGTSAVILIPLGPKMFALCSIVTALLFPEISVWRMSQGLISSPSDRLPTNCYSVLRVYR